MRLAESHGVAREDFLSVRLETFESHESFVVQGRWPDSRRAPMWTKENRAKYNRDHLRYPSDLTDDEWVLLLDRSFHQRKSGGGQRRTDMRARYMGLCIS